MKAILRLCVASVLIMSLVLTGCSNSKSVDRNRVVAEVNGEKILMGEFLDNYNMAKGQYGITDENEKDEENQELIANIKSALLENLVYEKIVMQKAKEEGFTVTDEILEQAKKEFDEIIASVEEQMKSEEGSEDVDYAAKAKEYIDEQLKAIGKTKDEYIQLIAEQIVIEKLMDKVIGEIEISDEEIKNYYETELKAQKEGSGDSTVILYSEPEVRVKHILIQIPKEEQTEYSNLVKENKTEEAKKYLEEKLKGIYPKANEVLAKVKKGEDFEKLIEEYGEDPGMEGNEEGYTVKQDGQFIEEFEKAAFSLKEGNVSGLVSSPYGYHIIKSYKVTGEKIATLEEKKDEIRQALYVEKEDEKWNTALTEWREAAKVVKYEDIL